MSHPLPRPAGQSRAALALSSFACALIGATSALAGSVPTTTEYSAMTAGALTRGELGTSVAVLGQIVFLGAPAADAQIPVAEGGGGGSTTDAGAVSRWERGSNGKFQQAGGSIFPSPAVSNGRFATGMASDADRLAITQASPPALRIYQVGLNANLQANLSPILVGPQGNSTRVAAALLGNTAAVGVVRNFSNSGSVEIYSFSGGQWSSTHRIDSPLPNVPDLGFGYSVTLTNDSLFVGIPAPVLISGNIVPGFVVRYSRPLSGTVWTPAEQFEPALEFPQDQPASYGFSMDSSGNLLVVGAPNLKTTQFGVPIGAVFVYELNTVNDSWELRSSIVNPDAEANAEFGYAVATNGSDILVGAPGANLLNGRSYLFTRTDDDQWTLRQRLVHTAAGAHRFGEQLAFTESNTAIITAPAFINFGGAAYEFLLDPLFNDGFE